MTDQINLEIIGYRNMECCPFPCNEERTCGLSACFPTGMLVPAVEALREKISDTFGDTITVTLTLLDEGVPDYIREIYESDHPAIPMILMNRGLLPIGRISWPPIEEAIRSALFGKS